MSNLCGGSKGAKTLVASVYIQSVMDGDMDEYTESVGGKKEDSAVNLVCA